MLNVAFSQRADGSGLVDVTFDLEDPDDLTVAVSLEASSDGGATWSLATATLSGDLGPAVPVGSGRALVWDFAQDNPDQYFSNVVVRITVLD